MQFYAYNRNCYVSIRQTDAAPCKRTREKAAPCTKTPSTTWPAAQSPPPPHSNRTFLERAAHKSREVAWGLLTGDAEPALSCCSRNVSFFVPGFRHSLRGPEALRSACQLISYTEDDEPLAVMDEHQRVTPLSADTCLVSSTYGIGRHGSEEESTSVMITMVWVMGPDQLPILAGIHGSDLSAHGRSETAAKRGQADDSPSNQDGSRAELFEFREVGGQTHWIPEKDIVFVKAAHQYTEIHCLDRTLRLHAPFGSVADKLKSVVVQVHRSYAVNPRYIDSLRGEILHLTTGDKVPVPTRRIREIRQQLGNITSGR